MFSLSIVALMSAIPSTPPRPDAPQLKDERLKNRIDIRPIHILSTWASLGPATPSTA